MGFFSSIKKFFGQEKDGPQTAEAQAEQKNGQFSFQAKNPVIKDTAILPRDEPPQQKAPEDPSDTETASAMPDNSPAQNDRQARPAPENENADKASEAGSTGQGKEFFQDMGEVSSAETEDIAVADASGIEQSGKVASGNTEIADDSSAPEDRMLLARLRAAPPRLSEWLNITLENVEEVDNLFWHRLQFLLRAIQAPESEISDFIADFRQWLERMEYRYISEFKSELQFRLALALDLEDEEDERNRLLVKLNESLARTREQFGRRLDYLFTSHGELDDEFWNEIEELFIMADFGYEPAMKMVAKLRERARREKAMKASDGKELLLAEIEEIFRQPRRIQAVNAPEVILMVGVNGVGKTTTIAKLAHRYRMQGKKVLIAAADTFRAAAIEQLQVWAERAGTDFYAKPAGSDPASVAWEAMDVALKNKADVVFIDTAGRLQTKVNLMEELGKIRQVLGKKHPGAPHKSILVLDATTGQNALSQAKLFNEAIGVDELILTKLDGTAKGGVAIAVAMQENLPITYVGLGEKMEDLRPFNGADFAKALLGENERPGVTGAICY